MSDSTSAGGAAPVETVLAQIRANESGGNYGLTPQQNYDYPRSHASGAYQFQPGTWQHWTQQSGIGTEYTEAYKAPPEVQDAVAAYAATHGDVNSKALWGGGKSTYPQVANALTQPTTGGNGLSMGVPQLQLSPQGNELTRPQAQAGPQAAPPSGNMALMLMSALLPKGWGFHKIDYDPFAAQKQAQQPVASAGPMGAYRAPQVASPAFSGATGPSTVPSRVGQKLSLGQLQRDVTGATSG